MKKAAVGPPQGNRRHPTVLLGKVKAMQALCETTTKCDAIAEEGEGQEEADVKAADDDGQGDA